MDGNDGLTILRGDEVVEKDHPTIAFRGKLDTLCAAILEAQVLGDREGVPAFARDLQAALDVARSVFSAEYTGGPLGEFRPLGLSRGELRERCRNPRAHFGRGHLSMDKGAGPLCARLNALRALARETELAAFAAFRDRSAPSGCSRPDVMEALGGLSALFYVLTHAHLPDGRPPPGDAPA